MFRYYFKRFYNEQYEKAGLKEFLNFFSVAFNHIDTNDILDIHKKLMKGKLTDVESLLLKAYS